MTKYFYIQSQLNKLVLTIEGFQCNGLLCMYPAYRGANQLWRWGDGNTLVSKMGLVADFQQMGGTKQCVGAIALTGDKNQAWQYTANEIQNMADNNLVMAISEAKLNTAAGVILWTRTAGLEQKWNLVPE